VIDYTINDATEKKYYTCFNGICTTKNEYNNYEKCKKLTRTLYDSITNFEESILKKIVKANATANETENKKLIEELHKNIDTLINDSNELYSIANTTYIEMQHVYESDDPLFLFFSLILALFFNEIIEKLEDIKTNIEIYLGLKKHIISYKNMIGK
jgi:hypothetical protein